MSVKASVSMSDQQDAFVRALVQQGRFASASAVVQRGLDLLQQETEREAAELAALRAFFAERANGPFDDTDPARSAAQDMIARKRAAHGL
ncbi:type II toxin-antitoxin system ParD family antitoxin [Salipiger sp. 1_MG-2023]|uniref:type II toxin-antitoxin system ParD family antitoxin n=1 Tax=Salipiger sp. 1_MG-2023 TaxID=3062665 RepID=UPI0026E1EFB4|nr:type II toxin-antitoxin system ParD family antitoxin [Salipiger sp. 1_MG-2023]MDO6584718.1 type II toxin-antitoxin system ParD family antitoxin [Salipiger sp. 1_MG-2023]